MRRKSLFKGRGYGKFFRVSLGHDSLANYYMTNFSLLYDYKINPDFLEEKPRYEKDIYIEMLIERQQEELERQQNNG